MLFQHIFIGENKEQFFKNMFATSVDYRTTDACSEPIRTFKIELFAKIVND